MLIFVEKVDSLNKFVKLCELKKLVLKAVAFSLTHDQIAQLREHFQSIDTDRSGTISSEELK